MIPGPAWSPERREAIVAFVHEIRRRLYLQHWRIDIDHGWLDEPDEKLAEIEPCDGRYLATIRFGTGFWAQGPDEKRSTIVHELIHLHHIRVTNAVRLDEYRHVLGKPLYDQLVATVIREAEYMVDALATIVVELPGLPVWPDVANPTCESDPPPSAGDTTKNIDSNGGSQLQHA